MHMHTLHVYSNYHWMIIINIHAYRSVKHTETHHMCMCTCKYLSLKIMITCTGFIIHATYMYMYILTRAEEGQVHTQENYKVWCFIVIVTIYPQCKGIFQVNYDCRTCTCI